RLEVLIISIYHGPKRLISYFETLVNGTLLPVSRISWITRSIEVIHHRFDVLSPNIFWIYVITFTVIGITVRAHLCTFDKCTINIAKFSLFKYAFCTPLFLYLLAVRIELTTVRLQVGCSTN